MAQEKELTLDGGDDDKGGGGSSKLIIIILVAIIVIGGAAAAFFLLGGDSAPEDAVGEPTNTVMPSYYFKIKPAFIANYVVEGRQRYLQVEMTLVTRNDSHVSLFNENMPFLQNDITAWLTEQAVDDLRDPESREALRATLVEELQVKFEEETGTNAIDDILFTGFVMQ